MRLFFVRQVAALKEELNKMMMAVSAALQRCVHCRCDETSPCRFGYTMRQRVFDNVHIDCAAGGTSEGGAEQGDGAELGAADSGLPAAADAGADCGRRSRCGCRAGGAAVQAAMKPSMIHGADPPAGRRLCRRALAALLQGAMKTCPWQTSGALRAVGAAMHAAMETPVKTR